jgi:biopolymer transport protein ExbD
MQTDRSDSQTVEIQMGPMIDMVFLLLVFFMVTAKPIKQESDISLSLPGTVSQEESVDLPDEQRIAIAPDGQVSLNEMPVDGPGDRQLPALVETLKRFKESSDANRTEALITIDSHDDTVQQRVVDVLNACAKAKITGVTFASADSEEEGW